MSTLTINEAIIEHVPHGKLLGVTTRISAKLC